MPLYFAYGSNMDVAAMRLRCPKARALGVGRLARHRFVLMRDGYASVHRDPAGIVHGVLYDLALSDIGPLDRYEDVAGGLYVKLAQPILRDDGAPCRALVYVGTSLETGTAVIPGYMESIVAAAESHGLPKAYVAMLRTHTTRSGAPRSERGRQGS